MLVLERRIAGLFRAALRRGLDVPARSAEQIPVLARLTRNGLFMHARQEPFSVMYHHPDVTGKGVFAFPASILGLFEGRTSDPVDITLQRPELAQARWNDRGGVKSIEIPLVDPGTVPIPPELPKEFTLLPMHFVPALHEAGRSAATQDTKYAISRVQLRGKSGTIVGTDTRQLLVQGGYEFPFKEDLLIPATQVFGLQPLHQYDDVGIGRTDTHLAIRIGPWTFVFALDLEARFPDATSIIPKSFNSATKLKLHPNDAQRFLDNLVRRIKGPGAKEHSVTLDLNEAPCLRFEIGESLVEVPFAESEFTGERVRICLNLAQFLRALELRFLEFEIRGPDRPVVARDGERIYMSMPLSAHAAVGPRPDASPVPIANEPSQALAPRKPLAVPAEERLEPQHGGPFDVLTEAEGLKDGLFMVATHAGRILRFLREVCTSQRVTEIFRSSLLSLFDRPVSGDKPA